VSVVHERGVVAQAHRAPNQPPEVLDRLLARPFAAARLAKFRGASAHHQQRLLLPGVRGRSYLSLAAGQFN